MAAFFHLNISWRLFGLTVGQSGQILGNNVRICGGNRTGYTSICKLMRVSALITTE